MSIDKDFSIEDDGYFGVTFMDIGTYGAHLMANRIVNTVDVSNLHFDNAIANYHHERHAVTVEGDASTISTPRFAIESLMAYASIARDFDVLDRPWAS